MKNLSPLFVSFTRIALYVSLFVLSVTACKHNDEVILGSTNKAASEGFIAGDICLAGISVTGVPEMICNPSYQPQFGLNNNQAERCYFNCDFNQEVTWTITIKGQTSGAIKTLTGTSAGLPFGNTKSIWKGDADPLTFRFFTRGEICDVKIIFQGSSIIRT